MAEERKLANQKLVKTILVDDESLPVHYVNLVNVRGGAQEFYFTLGTAVPPEITDIKDLENIDAIRAHPVFRFVLPRDVMKQLIDVMQGAYDQQTKQIEMVESSQEKGQEYDGSNSISSTLL